MDRLGLGYDRLKAIKSPEEIVAIRKAAHMQDEIFAPILYIVEFDHLEQAIAMHNDVPQGLSSSIFTRDVNKAFRAMRDLQAGITYINAGTIGAEVHLPFGGTKDTGNGHREAGQAALDVFTEWKSIYVDYSGKLQKAQIDTEI